MSRNDKATPNTSSGQIHQALSRIAGVALAIFAFTPFAAAQSYPTRTITLIVPFAPGGPADVLGRIIGQKLSEEFGQQVVIDNRLGANTIVGAQAAARAKPDGYTLLLAIDGTLVMNPYLYTKLPYDPFKDFEPVTLVAAVPSAITAAITTLVNTVKDIVDIEKAKPGTLQIGVSTPTSQVAIGLLNMRAGIKLTMIPYRGGTTQITSMLAGDIPIGHESVNVSLPLYREKKIKIVALTGQQRLELAPEIPTISETYPASTWASGRAWSHRPARPRRSWCGCTPRSTRYWRCRTCETGSSRSASALRQPDPGGVCNVCERASRIRSQVIKRWESD